MESKAYRCIWKKNKHGLQIMHCIWQLKIHLMETAGVSGRQN